MKELGRPKADRPQGSKEMYYVPSANKKSQYYLTDHIRNVPQMTNFFYFCKDAYENLKASHDKWSHPTM